LKIAALGKNVYVKDSITNARGEPSLPLIRELAAQQVKLNIHRYSHTRSGARPSPRSQSRCFTLPWSPFSPGASRSGVDPVPLMRARLALLEGQPGWNCFGPACEGTEHPQAEQCGCQIVTCHMTFAKPSTAARCDLAALSLDTVKMFSRTPPRLDFTHLTALEDLSPTGCC